MKLSSVLWNYCIMNASVCLESSICSQVCQQEHVTQMQLTPINIIMEGHEDIRIPIQIRMIPWWKTLKSQSIPIYFSKHSALQSGTDSHVKKKTDDSLSPKSQRRKRQLQKKTQQPPNQTCRRLELEEGSCFCSMVSAVQLSSELLGRESVSNGIKVTCKYPKAFWFLQPELKKCSVLV